MAAANGAPPSYNLIGFNGNQWRYDAKYRSAGAGIKLAVIVIATLPILAVYPFLQKHFAKGMLIGSVKG